MIKGKIGAKMGSRDISSSTNVPDYLNSQVKGRVCVSLSSANLYREEKNSVERHE
jgi:hypothetical protein